MMSVCYHSVNIFVLAIIQFASIHISFYLVVHCEIIIVFLFDLGSWKQCIFS